MSWRDRALECMFEVYFEQIKAGVVDAVAIAKEIDRAYPFGERKYHPYKAWLSARKWFFATKGLPSRAGRKIGPDLFSQKGASQ